MLFSASRALPDASQADGRVVLGVDLGATKLLAGLADLDGTILTAGEEPTRHGTGAPVLRQIADLAGALCGQAGVARSALVQAMVGVPGSVASGTGLVSLSPNLDLPGDRPLGELLAQALECPVDVDNDVNLAAFGEARIGHGREARALAFISFGTGVGLGLVVNGEVLRGASGRAGEIGFLPVGATPHRRAVHAPGGLFEELVGSAAIRARHGVDNVSVAEIFDQAQDGLQRALKTIDETARFASLGLASVQALIDPDLIVLGGSIGARPEFAQAVARHLRRLLDAPAPIVVSALGRRAGLVGAVEAAAHAARALPQPALAGAAR